MKLRIKKYESRIKVGNGKTMIHNTKENMKHKLLKLKTMIHDSRFMIPKRLSRKRLTIVSLVIIAVLVPIAILMLMNAGKASAAWFNENWGYRQAIPVTSTEGASQSNVFVSFTLDTATLISNGKLQSNCQDIRITDVNGKLLKYHVGRATACNNAATSIDFLLSSFPDGQSTYYVYYGNPQAPSTDAGALTVSQASAANLTVSGNEITDATRSASLQGDGVTSPDSSYGIWQGTTNLVTNGGFESNASSWGTRSSGVLSRVTSDFKFGTASLNITTPGSILGEGATSFKAIGGAAPATTYTLSFWVKGTATIFPSIDWYQADGTYISSSNGSNVTLGGGWQKVTFSATSPALTGQTDVAIATSSTPQAATFYIDGVQLEASSIATPYVETNGATAARAAARVQVPAMALNTTQGWIAVRFRTGWANGASVSSSPTLFDWTDDANNIITSYYLKADNTFYFNRASGGSGNTLGVTSLAFAAGTAKTVISTWTSTTIKNSVDGGSFSSRGNTNIPTLAASQFDIGSNGTGGGLLSSDVLWFAAGKGTLTDSDAATLYNMANTDPTPSAVATLSGGLATPTFIWTADTAADTQTTYTQYPARNYTIGALATAEQSPAPVAYWKFDDGGGTIATDSTVQRNNGTLSGSTLPTWQTEDQCISGKCLFFDGNTSYINVATSSALRPVSLSISVWIKPQSKTSNQTIISNRPDNATIRGYVLTVLPSNSGTPNVIRFSVTTNGSGYGVNLIGTTVVTDGKWHHIEGTFTSGNANLYIDGNLQASSTSTTGSIYYTNDNVRIGADSNGTNFKGFIDDVKVYPYARTASQIQSDYNSRGSKAASAATFGSSINNQPSALTNGLVGYWKMDEATWSGTLNEVIDSSGNGNNGQAGGVTGIKAYATSSAKFGNAGYFDGLNDYVEIPDNDVFSVNTTNQMTIALWVYLPNLPSIPVKPISKDFSGNYEWDMRINTSGQPSIWLTTANGAGTVMTTSSNTNITPGQWTHIVATINLSTPIIKIYVNGTLTGSSTALTGTYTNDTSKLDFGRSGDGGNYFPGYVDEARIYNRALSPADVQTLYNWAPGPVAYYNFEEGQGSTLNDISGYGNNGILTNSPKWIPGKYGTGLQFNGTTNYASVSSTLNNNFDYNQDFTISFWMNAPNANQLDTNGGTNVLVEKWSSAGSYPFACRYGNQTGVLGSVVCLRYDGTHNPSASIAGGSLNDNKWHYITFTKNGSTLGIYLDGVLKSTANDSTTTATTNTAPVWIGARLAGGNMIYKFKGSLDEIRLYNYARTAKQIVSDMNAGHPNVGSPVGSPVGYWKLDEGYGQLVNNSGNGGAALNGTLGSNNTIESTDPVWTNDGKFGKALSFDGSSDYVNAGSNAAINSIANAVTASAWVKMANLSSSYYILSNDRDLAGTYAGYDLSVNVISATYNAGAAQFRIWDSTNTRQTVSVPAGTLYANRWYHLVGVFNGTQLLLYINGVLKATTNYTGTMKTPASYNMNIGALGYNHGLNFNGLIDEVKIYNYALTADEVKLDYNHGSSVQMGSFSDTSGLTGGQVASNSASALYCIPGDTSTCSTPVGEWNFEEYQGSTVNDISGNNNAGTWNGTPPYWTQGKKGWGGKFNGSDNYVSLSNSVNLSPGSGDITVEAWVYSNVSDTNQHWIYDDYGSSNNALVVLEMDSGGKYDFILRDDNNNLASAPQSPLAVVNKWLHLVGIRQGTNVYLYVNGVLAGSGNNASLGTVTTSNASVPAFGRANSNPGAYWNGKIDQVRIYNYARTPAQIAWDYNQGAPIGWWKMDECQGTNIGDFSGNGNNGTINGSTAVGTCVDGTNTTKWSKGSVGKFNSSLYFDGTDDYVNIYSSGLNNVFNNSQGTLSLWTKVSGSGVWTDGILRRPILIGADTSSNYVTFGKSASSNIFSWFYNSGGTLSRVDKSLSDTNWMHIVITWNKSVDQMKAYYDGKQMGTTQTGLGTWSGSLSSSDAVIGAVSTVSGQYWSGQIDDVRIYNYALTPLQIQMVYNQGAGVRFGPNTGTP